MTVLGLNKSFDDVNVCLYLFIFQFQRSLPDDLEEEGVLGLPQEKKIFVFAQIFTI